MSTPQPHLFQSQPPGTMPATPSHAQPAGAMPSLGAVMNAPTGTMHAPLAMTRPGGKSRMTKVAIILVVVLVSGLITFGIAMGMRGGKTTETPVAVVPDAGGSAVGVMPDTAPAPPAEAGPTDAGLADAPTPPADAKKEALDAQKKDPVVVVKKGLSVPFPAATVYVDGKKMGDSPGAFDVPSGKHKVRLENPDSGFHNLTISVTIKVGGQVTLGFDATKKRLFLQ